MNMTGTMSEGQGERGYPSAGNGGGGQLQTVPGIAAPSAPDPGWLPAAPPPLPPHAPPPPPATRSSSRARRGLFRLLLVLCLVIAAGGATYAVVTYQNQSQPGIVVQDYFAAVAADDAPTALSYGAMPPGPQSLLTDAALRDQTAIAPMTGITVVAVNQHGNEALVTVRYNLTFPKPRGVVVVNDNVKTVRRGHVWRLAAVAIPLQLNLAQAADRAELDGSAVPTNSQLYFPGALALTFDTPNLALTQSPTIQFDKPDIADLTVQVTVVGQQAIWLAMDNALKQCLAGTFAAPATCPMPSVQDAVPGTLRGTTTYSPTSSIVNLVVLNSRDGAVSVRSAAPVSGQYQALDYNNLPVPTPVYTTLSLVATCSALAPNTIFWTLSS